VEEVEVVTAGEGEQRASGREYRNGRASWEYHRLYFILFYFKKQWRPDHGTLAL
jgi:hypothetical protein